MAKKTTTQSKKAKKPSRKKAPAGKATKGTKARKASKRTVKKQAAPLPAKPAPGSGPEYPLLCAEAAETRAVCLSM